MDENVIAFTNTTEVSWNYLVLDGPDDDPDLNKAKLAGSSAAAIHTCAGTYPRG